MKHRLIVAGVTFVVALAGLVWYLDSQHSYAMSSEQLTFESGGNTLDATLALPRGDGPFGVVAFVHGDGATDATRGGGYLPIFEALANAGYASISWSKPGVGDSTGDWLDQSMDDRANEVRDAIAVLSQRGDIDLDRVGAIGFSQGGWVLPLLPDRIEELDFIIAGSPAINWLEQGHYLTEQEVLTDGTDADLAERVRRADVEGDEVLASGDYDDHVAWVESLDDDVAHYFSTMDEDRWAFVRRNLDLDATETLPAQRDVPTLLLLAGNDENVDVADTESTYRDILSPDTLTVATFPDANHSLIDHDGFGLTMTAIFRPRSIFADGVLDTIESFAASR